MAKALSQEDVRQQLNSRVSKILANTPVYHRDLVSQAVVSYERKHGVKMSPEKKSVLVNSINHMEEILSKRGVTREQIASAVSDLSQVENPITMLFTLMSIIIPNFAYGEAIGIQPMPTAKSPVYFPVIEANEERNGVSKGEQLLGASNWNTKNTYSTNRNVVDMTATVGASSTFSHTVTEANIIPGTVAVTLVIPGKGTFIITDDGKGAIPEVAGATTGAGTVSYATGAVSFTLAAALNNSGNGDTIALSYRYNFTEGTKPAQVVFKWADRLIEAFPYRLRSTYELDNFYAAKQVLNGFDIDAVMSSSLAGYINKEISGNVFDDLLLQADADYAWDSAVASGDSWALHRLSLLQKLVEASNGIRQNVGRASGNVLVAGTGLMNVIETLGSDLWVPKSYSAEPIGPYEAGTLANRFKVIKNQDFPTSKGVMVFKREETDASVIGGSFISLYSTPALALDDLNVVQGMGTRFGYSKVLENSITSITVV